MKKITSLLFAALIMCVSISSNCSGSDEDLVFVTGVSLDKTSVDLTVGATETLTATVTPPDATVKAAVFTSNNTNVATVSNSSPTTGLVTAIAEGTAIITAAALGLATLLLLSLQGVAQDFSNIKNMKPFTIL